MDIGIALVIPSVPAVLLFLNFPMFPLTFPANGEVAKDGKAWTCLLQWRQIRTKSIPREPNTP